MGLADGRRSAASTDADSDFMPVIEDDSDVDGVPMTSSRRGSSVSRPSDLESNTGDDTMPSDSDMSDVPKKKKSSIKPKEGKGANRPPVATGHSSSNNFLTAAEQREKNKKSEKKSTEDPFEFLKDVRDVSRFSQ